MGWASGQRRRRVAKLLVNRDGPVCYLCERPVLFLFQIDKYESLLYVFEDRLVWYLGFRGRRFFVCRRGTVDHVKPRSKGGSDDLDNLKLACADCNKLKGSGKPKVKKLTRINGRSRYISQGYTRGSG